jgi:hypothetical protein
LDKITGWHIEEFEKNPLNFDIKSKEFQTSLDLWEKKGIKTPDEAD